jgi:hypothetical protein
VPPPRIILQTAQTTFTFYFLKQNSEISPNQSNMTTPETTAPTAAPVTAPAVGSPDYVDKGD